MKLLELLNIVFIMNIFYFYFIIFFSNKNKCNGFKYSKQTREQQIEPNLLIFQIYRIQCCLVFPTTNTFQNL